MVDDTSFLTRFAGFTAAHLAKFWLSSLDTQVVAYDDRVDPLLPDFKGPVIFVLWHEYISFPISIWSNRGIPCSLLVSKHRDADVLCRTAAHLGFRVVRGSTNRGGDRAMRELQRRSKNSNLAITPDGPRGPRRKMSSGPIFLSSKLQMPIVAMGIGYHQPWRVNTWDRFAIPKPFSRGRLVASPPLQIPPNVKREEIEHYRVSVERTLNRLTDEAEQWAGNGDRRVEQRPAISTLPAPLSSLAPPESTIQLRLYTGEEANKAA